MAHVQRFTANGNRGYAGAPTREMAKSLKSQNMNFIITSGDYRGRGTAGNGK
jgi:hypothetical protein